MKVREDFEYLKNGVIYFDNAATSQKPKQVVNAIVDYYNNYCANIHRGVHKLSQKASDEYENAHDKMGKFVNVKWDEVIFTRNTTESLNLIYYSWGLRNLRKGDNIVTSLMEHHSNYVPFLELKKHFGIDVRIVDVNEDGSLKMEQYNELIDDKTKIVAITHVSNSLGSINDVKEIGKRVKESNALFVVDGAQSVPHMKVNFKELNADFLAFSGHKMLGPTGIGALIGRRDLLEEMDPFLFGGDMIHEVHRDSWKVNKLPWKFEAGTPSIAQGIGFKAAVEYLSKIGMDKVREHEKELVEYCLNKMKEIENVKIYGSLNSKKRGGVITFNVNNLLCHDTAKMLDSMGNIACRSGMLCAQPLVESLDDNGVVRASFYIYNTKEEIDEFIEALEKISKI